MIAISHESLSESLKKLKKLEDTSPNIALGTVLELVGDKGFGVFLVVLSGPSALPVPAPGYSTPFGILLICLGMQMLLGRNIPWLPRWSQKISLSVDVVNKMVDFIAACLKWVEFFINPRLSWIGSRYGRPLMGILVIIMAFLMIIPIPLTNTFPAFVIFLIGLGLSEDDGLFAVFACLVGVFSVLLYVGVLYIFFMFGIEGIEHLKDSIFTFLSSP